MERFDLPVSDQELFGDFVKKGHEDSFNVLVQHYKLRLFNVAFRVLQDRYTAEDVVQKVFVRLFEQKNELVTVKSLRPRLYKTALSISLSTKRSMRRREDREKVGESISTPETPREAAAKAELREELKLALTKLKDSLRIPLILRYLEGLPHAETSEIMNLSSEAIRTRIRRG